MSILDTIAANHPLCFDRLAEVVKEWSCLNYDVKKFGCPNWRKLAEAVASFNKRLFYSLAYEHKKGGETSIQATNDEGMDIQAKGASIQASNDEGASIQASNDEGMSIQASNDEGTSIRASNDEGTSIQTSNDEGTSIQASNDEGTSIQASNDEGTSIQASNDEGMSIQASNDEGTNIQSSNISVKQKGTTAPSAKVKPKPVFEVDDNSIHSITLSESGFSAGECERREQKNRARSMLILSKYEALFTKFQKSLEEREIPVRKLAKHLLGFQAFDQAYACDSNQILFAEEYEMLSKAEDLDEALLIVRKYSSFFSYQILKQLILNLGTENDKEELLKYENAFQEYAKSRLYECPSKFGSDTNQAKVFITLDKAYKNCSLNHLLLLTRNLSEIFHVSVTGVLRLYSIGNGSIKLVFLIPHFVERYIFPLSTEQIQALREIQVIKISSGEFVYSVNQQEVGIMHAYYVGHVYILFSFIKTAPAE